MPTISRRQVLFVLGAAIAAPKTALAQPAKVSRIGFLHEGSRTATNISRGVDGFLSGMRDLGYVEGKNLAIEWRFADGKFDRVPALAAELATMDIAVLMTGGDRAASAAKTATSKVPIVMFVLSDPVALGLVSSLRRPGGNITGINAMGTELNVKWIELLREAIPKLTRVALFLDGSGLGNSAGIYLKQTEAGGKAAGVQIMPVYVKPTDDIAIGIQTAVRGRAQAILLQTVGTFGLQAPQINSLALKGRLPTMYGNAVAVEQGGLMSYGTNFIEQWRRTATYVDKILKGANPGELPVEQPTILEFAINLKTAKALGLTIPPQLLFRADRVIE